MILEKFVKNQYFDTLAISKIMLAFMIAFVCSYIYSTNSEASTSASALSVIFYATLSKSPPDLSIDSTLFIYLLRNEFSRSYKASFYDKSISFSFYY